MEAGVQEFATCLAAIAESQYMPMEVCFQSRGSSSTVTTPTQQGDVEWMHAYEVDPEHVLE
eukprot:457074-Amphidinium_carterae.1